MPTLTPGSRPLPSERGAASRFRTDCLTAQGLAAGCRHAIANTSAILSSFDQLVRRQARVEELPGGLDSIGHLSSEVDRHGGNGSVGAPWLTMITRGRWVRNRAT